MSASQRNKGAWAERAVARWLRENGYPDARRYSGADGKAPGDIDAIPGVCIEVKNQATYDIPAWLRQTVEEAVWRLPLLIVKPKGVTDVGDWWAVMRFEDAIELLENAVDLLENDE